HATGHTGSQGRGVTATGPAAADRRRVSHDPMHPWRARGSPMERRADTWHGSGSSRSGPCRLVGCTTAWCADPELVLAGVPWPAAVSTLNALGEMVAVGEVLTPGQAPVVVGEVELAVGRVVELCDTHTPLVL